MILRAFGEILTDVLTINPAIAYIPSASAILDTSNFTFQAMTFGNDSGGYTRHAHAVSAVNLGTGIYNDGYLLIQRYNSTSPSSYHSSAVHAVFSSTYNSVPNYPSIYDTRLERGSTLTNISGTSDVGHYLNSAIDPSFSSVWNVVGGFPPSGNTAQYRLVTSAGAFVMSGTLSSMFNRYGTMDKNGYLKFTDLNATAVSASDWSGLARVSAFASISATPSILISVALQLGDAACLAAFGGVNHIGFYCFDLQQMLNDGLRPPFAWNNLNNSRKYKLVAKTTFWSDLLHHIDATEAGAILGLSLLGGPPAGFKSLLELGLNTLYPTNKGPAYIFTLSFA